MLLGLQAVEVRNAVDAEQHPLAIARAVAQRGLDDLADSGRSDVAVFGKQPHAPALALDDQAIAVVLDFTEQVWPGGNLGSGCTVRTLLHACRIFGRFERRIPLDDVDEEKVEASFRKRCPEGYSAEIADCQGKCEKNHDQCEQLNVRRQRRNQTRQWMMGSHAADDRA